MRCFLWVTTHKKLMTAKRRSKLFGAPPFCHRCQGVQETQEHLLRDCPAASRILTQFIHPTFLQDFFRAPFEAWLRWNLSTELGRSNQIDWITQFVVTCWWLWRWRNKEIFMPGFTRSNDPCSFICNQAISIRNAPYKLYTGEYREKVERQISWSCPPTNWIKLNSDGASCGNPGTASYGGLLRDEMGHWVAGYYSNLRICSAFQAEIWGLLHGLKTAWELGIRRLIVDLDSKVLMDVITKENAENYPSNLIRIISKWLKKN
ncbi:hypothetical protein AHAS_Ahas19G0272500 [Arachis hypogaea]